MKNYASDCTNEPTPPGLSHIEHVSFRESTVQVPAGVVELSDESLALIYGGGIGSSDIGGNAAQGGVGVNLLSGLGVLGTGN